MLSRPRNPPWKTLRPSLSLRFTHQVKLSSSLWKMRFQEVAVAYAAALLLDLVDAPGGPGMHRRIDIAERPLVGREAARWDACTTRASSAPAALWRTRESTSASGTQWNARSQAAYHGYSHLSGMEITSAL